MSGGIGEAAARQSGPQAGGVDPGVAWRRVVVGIPAAEFEPGSSRSPGVNAYPPDTECDGWSTPELTLRSAAVRGDSHRYYRRPRQDFTRSAVHEATGAVVFAVADGVSNAESGEIGAADACHLAVDALLAQLDRGAGRLDFQLIAAQVAERLRQRAGHLLRTQQPPDWVQVETLLATTLVAGAACHGPGGVTVSLFRVGDSGAWLLEPADGRYRPLFGTKTGTDVVILPDGVTALPWVPRPVDQAAVQLAPGQVLLAGTDGFGDPLGDGSGEVGALFARHLAAPPRPLWLAHVLDFSRETFDDDRALLALWPRGGREAG